MVVVLHVLVNLLIFSICVSFASGFYGFMDAFGNF